MMSAEQLSGFDACSVAAAALFLFTRLVYVNQMHGVPALLYIM